MTSQKVVDYLVNSVFLWLAQDAHDLPKQFLLADALASHWDTMDAVEKTQISDALLWMLYRRSST